MNTLVQRLKDRDPEAMAELYDLYGRLAFAIILRIVRDHATAEDLTQEAFLRIWNSAATYDETRSSLVQWITAICRNRAFDYLRSVECRMSRETVDVEQVRAGSSGSVSHDTLMNDLLRKAMAGLTPDQLFALNLWYREGMSHTEIAKKTRTPLGTVKTRLRVTLRAMREHLLAPPDFLRVASVPKLTATH